MKCHKRSGESQMERSEGPVILSEAKDDRVGVIPPYYFVNLHYRIPIH